MTIRVPRSVAEAVVSRAREQGVSRSKWVAETLAGAVGAPTVEAHRAEVRERVTATRRSGTAQAPAGHHHSAVAHRLTQRGVDAEIAGILVAGRDIDICVERITEALDR